MKLLRTAVILAALWLAISTAIFQFRHPWAPPAQTLLHLPDALLLRKVPQPTDP